ncbi:MAG TPA: hypothetical protein VFH92_09210 [Phenylobacterium sp.]|nr:hypothetical protein [Phenylobacterium sp.]
MKTLSGESPRLRALALAVGLLLATAGDVEDPGEAATYYATAEQLVAQLVATPARTFGGLQVKAEMVAWCCGSRTDFALGRTASERVIASMLGDLLSSDENMTGTSGLPGTVARI